MHCKACNKILGEKEQQIDKRTGLIGVLCYECIFIGCGSEITKMLFGDESGANELIEDNEGTIDSEIHEQSDYATYDEDTELELCEVVSYAY